MENKISVKLSSENKGFLNRININRIICKTENSPTSLSHALDMIEKYFKLHNDEYLKLCKMENIKNV